MILLIPAAVGLGVYALSTDLKSAFIERRNLVQDTLLHSSCSWLLESFQVSVCLIPKDRKD